MRRDFAAACGELQRQYLAQQFMQTRQLMAAGVYGFTYDPIQLPLPLNATQQLLRCAGGKLRKASPSN